MAGTSAEIRLQIAALLAGTFDLDQFQRWFAAAALAIELHGSEEDVDLANRVLNLVAEYTGDHVSAATLLRALCGEVSCRESGIAAAAVA